MKLQELDLSSFKNAIQQLSDSVNNYQRDIIQQDKKLKLQMRAGAIQAFEFTYELAWKMIKRYLEITSPSITEIQLMSFPDLIRTACEQGLLLSDITVWKEYRRARGITSHTYDENKSLEIFNKIPSFLEDVTFLLKQLTTRKRSQQ